MTFEDYKKDFERFAVIDSPEKLAHCEKMYQQHLLYLEEQNYFEPFEYRTGDDLSSVYEQRLGVLLPFDEIKENQITFLLRPSFTPEGLLVIDILPDKCVLTFTTLLENFWSVLYEDQEAIQVERKTLTGELPKRIGDQLVAMVDSAIAATRKPTSAWAVLDGAVYVLTKVVDGKPLSVFKHSPNEDSKTGKVINVFLHLGKNVMELEGEKLQHLERLIAEYW
ncbi:MAG: hypothetical protein J7621_30360 [Niastella sp.]|nr:hypothetical protein [Niastella sp.]